VVKKPDSLRRAFKTRNGRTVYDGNGITPDVEISIPRPTLLQSSLQHQNQFFDFANHYAATHDSLAELFSSDKLYQSFMTFLEQEGFHYQTSSEIYLAKIDSSMGGKIVETHIDAIRQHIDSLKKKAFYEQREEIEKELYLELLTRYKGKQEQIAASLPYDHFVNQAIDLFHNPNRYKNILSSSN
jgi:carboxyl-terminal processing protease